MHEGNYLAFAIANHWIDELIYVYPVEPPDIFAARAAALQRMGEQALQVRPDDVSPLYFLNMDLDTSIIQLKHYRDFDAFDMMEINRGAWHWRKPDGAGEPHVPFRMVPATDFQFEEFTHIVAAHSPRFTPPRADRLLAVILEYVRQNRR
jgi:hypothetical protein